MAFPWRPMDDNHGSMRSFGEVITRGVPDWQGNASHAVGRPTYSGHVSQMPSVSDYVMILQLKKNPKKLHAAGTTTTPGLYDSPEQPLTVSLTDKDLEDLQIAVTTLYEDEIFPDFQSLKARLQQQDSSPTVLANFLDIYDRLPGFRVHRNFDPEATLFLHEPKSFGSWVDPNSTDDPYPAEMWDAFKKYLTSILANAGDTSMVTDWSNAPFAFHRGRYGMAQELLNRKLPFFKDITLGKMCHIVELAIKKKLLAYEHNMLVPAAVCVSLTNAYHGSPTASTQPPGCTIYDEYIADEAELKTAMSQVLLEFPDGFNLSTLKTKMRAIYRKRLSETVFHQTKLLDLVQRPPLSEVCVIEKMDGNCGYFVFPTAAMRDVMKSDEETRTRRNYYPRYQGAHSGFQHQYRSRGSSYGSDRASTGTNRSNPSPPQQRSHYLQNRNSTKSSGRATPPAKECGSEYPVILDNWESGNRELLQRAPPGFEWDAATSSGNPRTSCQSDNYVPMKEPGSVDRESFNSV